MPRPVGNGLGPCIDCLEDVIPNLTLETFVKKEK